MNNAVFRLLLLVGLQVQWEASCLSRFGHDGRTRRWMVYILSWRMMGLGEIRGSSGDVVNVC